MYLFKSGAGYRSFHRLSQYLFLASETTDYADSTDKKTANRHLFVFAEGKLCHSYQQSAIEGFHFLYAGTSGKAGGSKPSSSSSSLLNARPAGVITRAVTKMTRFRLIC